MGPETAASEEIEVTPAMIDAGEEVLFEAWRYGFFDKYNQRELALDIYLAMARKACSKSAKSPRSH